MTTHETRMRQLADYGGELLEWFAARNITVPEQTGIMMAILGVNVSSLARSKNDAVVGLELAFNIARSAADVPTRDIAT